MPEIRFPNQPFRSIMLTCRDLLGASHRCCANCKRTGRRPYTSPIGTDGKPDYFCRVSAMLCCVAWDEVAAMSKEQWLKVARRCGFTPGQTREEYMVSIGSPVAPAKPAPPVLTLRLKKKRSL